MKRIPQAITTQAEPPVRSRPGGLHSDKPRSPPKPAAQGPISTAAIELADIGSLRPYQGNPRTHSRKQVRQIADSIRRFGFTNPVLIGDDGEIIAGHGRVEAAKLLGLESVPTLRLAHLDAAQRRAYVLADNKLALNAGWDQDLLAIELQGLIDLEFEVELTWWRLWRASAPPKSRSFSTRRARAPPTVRQSQRIRSPSPPTIRRPRSRGQATCGASAAIV
jgi:ParB-like chromosome segregation protein Spo0J